MPADTNGEAISLRRAAFVQREPPFLPPWKCYEARLRGCFGCPFHSISSLHFSSHISIQLTTPDPTHAVGSGVTFGCFGLRLSRKEVGAEPNFISSVGLFFSVSARSGACRSLSRVRPGRIRRSRTPSICSSVRFIVGGIFPVGVSPDGSPASTSRSRCLYVPYGTGGAHLEHRAWRRLSYCTYVQCWRNKRAKECRRASHGGICKPYREAGPDSTLRLRSGFLHIPKGKMRK